MSPPHVIIIINARFLVTYLLTYLPGSTNPQADQADHRSFIIPIDHRQVS